MEYAIGLGDESVEAGGSMDEVKCPICHKRVSNWEMAGGKCTIIHGRVTHNSCLMDVKPSEAKEATSGED